MAFGYHQPSVSRWVILWAVDPYISTWRTNKWPSSGTAHDTIFEPGERSFYAYQNSSAGHLMSFLA
jgi:hypothetical protein